MEEVQAVGAGAANQAVKAIAIARGYLAPIGVDLVCIPAIAPATEFGDEWDDTFKISIEKRPPVIINFQSFIVFCGCLA